MATINLGRVGFVLKGAYDETATYTELDLVMGGDGVTYVATATSTGAPLTDSAKWQKLMDGDYAAGKADKVANAVENNFAAFDDAGNLKDSGKTSADFASTQQLGVIQTDLEGMLEDDDALTNIEIQALLDSVV